MSNAKPGPGFILQVDDGGGVSFTTIGEVKDITGPGISVDIFDVTNQSSPGGYEEIVPTIRRPGEVDFDVNFNAGDATHDGATGLVYLANNKVKRTYRLYVDAALTNYWLFQGYVTGLGGKLPVAGVSTVTVKIKITGQPTLN